MSDTQLQVSTRWGRSTAFATIPAPVGVVPHLVPRAVRHSKRFADRSLDGWSAVLTCKPNMWTWGGKITLTFSPTSPTSTAVHARWEPDVPTTLITWGQGKRDIRELLWLIAEEATRAAPPPAATH